MTGMVILFYLKANCGGAPIVVIFSLMNVGYCREHGYRTEKGMYHERKSGVEIDS